MSSVNDLASRYAGALFELTHEKNLSQRVLAEMRQLRQIFNDPSIGQMLLSPVMPLKTKEEALDKALASSPMSDELKQFSLLLVSKGRLEFFDAILIAFEKKIDESNGVARGLVKSAVALGPNERQRIQTIVTNKVGKNVVLSYEEDPDLLGGLVAQVGSYRFDDSIKTHLQRMAENLQGGTL